MASTSVGAAVSSAAPKLVKEVTRQALQQAPQWVRNLPTRQIAYVLLKQERHLMDHGELYDEVEKSGMFRSKRHFKHCLRMLKNQERVHVICRGPERVGSAKRLFSVKLTRKGAKIYTRYNEEESPPADKTEKKGLAEALV